MTFSVDKKHPLKKEYQSFLVLTCEIKLISPVTAPNKRPIAINLWKGPYITSDDQNATEIQNY